MAQAVFDQHPLEQYLQDAGETPNFIPGSSFELDHELEPVRNDDKDQPEWRPLLLTRCLEVFISLILPPVQTSPFVERFKYNVISSSLLSVALPSTHSRTPRFSLPGQLDHRRSQSIESDITMQSLAISPSQPSYFIPSLFLALFAISLNTGYTTLAIVFFATAIYCLQNLDEPSKHDMSPSLESLSDMIAAVGEWESVVQETFNTLESLEQSSSFNAGTSSPCSSVRMALGSSLLTTQTQCDNIRHLLSALTSPSELSQLSEMYAPVTPSNSSFSPDIGRPFSFPAQAGASSPLTDYSNKRQTWNGSHSRFARVTSPTTHLSRIKEKRRSDLVSLLHSPSHPSLTSVSAPVTPLRRSLSPTRPLSLVTEESKCDSAEDDPVPDEPLSFGAAALELRRNRMSAGMATFAPHSPSPPFSPPLQPLSTPEAPSTGCRFTPIQASRHPNSMSALTHTLQGVFASKRYACSHLLALRFTDEEDEGYWEDVRSVMGLLTSAFLDASAALDDVLQEAEQQKLRDSNPTPFSCSDEGRSFEKLVPLTTGEKRTRRRRRTEGGSGSGSVSFAPLPSRLSRFMGHVEAVSQALDDARENLEMCVAALRDEGESRSSSGGRARKRKRGSRAALASGGGPAEQGEEEDEGEASCALEAYERLRRELGLALRECERGRERLLDVMFTADDEDDSLGEEDDLPGLGHDASDDSDKRESPFPFDDDLEQEEQREASGAYAIVASSNDAGGGFGGALDDDDDDATPHLLLAASTQGLPLPGIEQVFEADSGSVGVFKRERSKLTREERIMLVKARRESGGGGGDVIRQGIEGALPEAKKGGIEKWGPGGEVVQELKDVIWKVGERRRKMADAGAGGLLNGSAVKAVS